MARSWSWLWPWRQPSVLADLRVIMYTRQGCHLCEDAWKVLQEAQRQFRFRLEAVDVDGDAELAVCHGTCVPVVTVNGKLRFRGAVNPRLLARLLQAEEARGVKRRER